MFFSYLLIIVKQTYYILTPIYIANLILNFHTEKYFSTCILRKDIGIRDKKVVNKTLFNTSLHNYPHSFRNEYNRSISPNRS
jgi:hypothetical protein